MYVWGKFGTATHTEIVPVYEVGPNHLRDPCRYVKELIKEGGGRFLSVCLGHQMVCRSLGLQAPLGELAPVNGHGPGSRVLHGHKLLTSSCGMVLVIRAIWTRRPMGDLPATSTPAFHMYPELLGNEVKPLSWDAGLSVGGIPL